MTVDSSVIVFLLFALLIVVVLFLVFTVVLFVKLLRLRKLLKDPEMPIQGKVAFWSAVVYAVVPIDLLPDPILVDDVGALLGAIAYIGKLASKYVGRRPAYQATTIDGHIDRRSLPPHSR